MANNIESGCARQFEQAAPAQPWSKDTPLTAFEPLIKLIDQKTQSDLFRRAGQKYESNGDYYELAQDLDMYGKPSGKTTFENGVTAEIEQTGGWPTRMILEDPAVGLKETVTLNPDSHTIATDKVEYCGVSRSRTFSQSGETYRSYEFNGGKVERSGSLPVLHLDEK